MLQRGQRIPFTSLATTYSLNKRPGCIHINFIYHDGLLDQSVAVLAHVLQDLVSSIMAGGGGRLGSHGQRVD